MSGKRPGDGSQGWSSSRRSFGSILLACLAACGGLDPDTLVITHRIPLPDSAWYVFHPQDAGTVWLGGVYGFLSIDTTGAVLVHSDAPGSRDIEVLGKTPGALFLRVSDAILRIDPDEGRVMAERTDSTSHILHLDPSGRFLYGLLEHGSVIAYDPETLEPVWGWAAIGATGTALSATLDGERLFQAAGNSADPAPPQILVRDVQTGRIVSRTERPYPVHSLTLARDGTLYGTEWRNETGTVFAMNWKNGALEEVWERSLASLDMTPPLRVRLSPDGRQLAVFANENETGLHVLDTETGRTVERLHGEVRDFMFNNGDYLLLAPEEVRRVE